MGAPHALAIELAVRIEAASRGVDADAALAVLRDSIALDGAGKPTGVADAFDQAAGQLVAAPIPAQTLSRAAIQAMPHADILQREEELNRWLAAGSIDGTAAPVVPKRPAGHVWTITEIESMSQTDIATNLPSIEQALASGALVRQP